MADRPYAGRHRSADPPSSPVSDLRAWLAQRERVDTVYVALGTSLAVFVALVTWGLR